MNTRKLLFTVLLIATLVPGVGMALAQDDGGSGDTAGSEREHSAPGRRVLPGRGRGMGRGFGGPTIIMPGGAGLMTLVTDATGLAAPELVSALRGGESLAGLIEAEGGDVAAFIAEATALATENANARIAGRIEAMVQGEHPAGKRDMDPRGYSRGGPRGFAGRGAPWPMAGMDASVLEVTGLEPRELFNALRSGESLASVIEANEGDVDAFIAGISESFNARVDEAVAAGKLDEERAAGYREGMTERLEALVHGEYTAREKGRDWRGATEKGSGEHGGRGRGEGAGEHGRGGKGVAGGPEAGEESGTTYALDETFDTVRNGVRLVMSWDAAANAFVGTVENTTDATIPAVRVEVHLSNGVELGPTPRADLAPGETRAVELSAAGVTGFDGWTPHAEMGAGDTGGGEGSGEHSGEGSGEGAGEHGNGGESGSG